MTRALYLGGAALISGSLLAAATPAVAADGWFGRHHRDREIEGSGVSATRTLDLEDFDSIRVDGVAEIDVTIGDRFSVELTADDNLIEFVDVDVRRGTLRIDLDEDVMFDDEDAFHFTITMPELVEVEVNGVCDLTATGIDNPRLRLEVNGVGHVEMSGSTGDLDVTSGGVATVDLTDLEARDATVEVGGVGNVFVTVTGELDARVGGLGSVIYHGNPRRVRDRVGSFGSVEPAD